MTGQCEEWVVTAGDLVQCPEKATEVRLPCPAGRPDAVAAYCELHGGQPLALEVAQSDWNYAAPESVGDVEAVQIAGGACLQTPEAYVVIRQTPENQGATWLAFLGLGSMLTPVANPEPAVRLQRDGRPRTRGGSRGRRSPDTPSRSFAIREAALSAARQTWEARVKERVDFIRKLRGGTLAWGLPVEPLAEPVVIVLEQGDSRSAWDVAVSLPARSRQGMASVYGLRPSGECA